VVTADSYHLFCVPHGRFCSAPAAAGHENAVSVGHVEAWPGAGNLLWQGLYQPLDYGRLPAHQHRVLQPFDQDRGSVEISRCERMTYRLVCRAVSLVPPACPLVKLGDQLGAFGVRALAQEIGEEVMVTVPAPPVAQRDHEQVPSLQFLERRLRSVLARHRVAQRAA
jgi:hypothetical protein